VIENQLRPVRRKIAHALFESGELRLSGDDHPQVETVINWLPVARCMVRGTLRNELPGDFLVHLLDP
jgi:hypothetical protein